MSVFRGGVPYQIDIRKLEAAFPIEELTEGRTIKHEEIEAVIDCAKGSQRYYGVVNSWASKLRNTASIILAWQPGDGIKRLDPAGHLNHAGTRFRQKGRQYNKAGKEFAWVERDRLNDAGKQRLDLHARIAEAQRDATRRAFKELAIELPAPKSLPKPKIVRKEEGAA